MNPYDCEKSQLYIILTSAKDSKKEKYENGVSSAFSKRVFKEPPYVWIKSCNYLANALMKKEAVDRGLELVIARNKDGVVLEGAVENVVIVTSDRELWIPSFDKTLSGTTVKRAIFHAKKLIPTALKNVCQKDFYHQDIKSAREFLAIGTTTKVLPIVRFEGENVGNGEVGPIAKQLASLIEEERAGTSCHYIFQ